MCGPLGGKHTSVTWPIATSDLSSVVGNLQDGFQSFQFNFTNALCPPSPEPVQPMTASGQPYRPVIAPPVAITNIDPMWVSNCWVGSPWQGIDPPIALKPAKNLSPATTKGRVARLAFATPSASMKAIPIQTSPPKQITSGHQPLKSLLDYLVIEHRSTGNRIPTVAASPTDLKGPSDPSHTTELADHDDSPGDTFRESYPDPSSESPSDILQDKNKDPGVSLQESYALTHDSPSASAEVTAAAFLSSSAVTTPLSFSASPNHVVVAGKPHSLISAATHLGSQSVVTPSDPQVATNLDPISAFTRSSKTFTPSTMIATLNGSRMSLGAQTMGGIISGSGRGAPSTSSSSSQGQQLFLGNAIRNTADFGRVFGWVLLTAGGLYGALRIAW
ncbi:hypothetical protein MMC20_008148 [Loxospora ochrophaea]|nr:hypothetical protein [Loxospora ochrophaea]